MAEIDNRKDLTDKQFEELKTLASLFCTKEDCASFFGIDADTLYRNIQDKYGITWREFFELHSGSGRVSLRRKQFESAMNGDKVMLIWLGKQHLGQTDKIEQKTHDVSKDSNTALLEELKSLLKK